MYVEVLFLAREIRRHVRQDRFLIEVILNHLRHEVVHHLVIRDAGADGVRERHIAGAVRVDEARHAERAVAAEDRGIEKIVVEPPVDHVDLLLPLRRAHEDAPVAHDEVAAFDDLDAHLPREIRVLEVRAVVRARRQQHDVRLRHAVRRDVLQHLQQAPADSAPPAARRCSSNIPGNVRFIAPRFSST